MGKQMSAIEAFNAVCDYLDGNENALDGWEEQDIIHPVHGKLTARYYEPWGGWLAEVWEWEDGFRELDFVDQ